MEPSPGPPRARYADRAIPPPTPVHPTLPHRSDQPRLKESVRPAAARRAFDDSAWSTDVELRVRCLRQLHAALLDHADEFRALTTAEVGMPRFMMGAAGFGGAVGGLAWVPDLLETFPNPCPGRP